MAKSVPYRNKLFVNTSWADQWPNPPDDTLPVTQDLRAQKFAIMRIRDGAMLAHHPTRGPLKKLARFFCKTGCQCVVRSRYATGAYWHDGESYNEFLANQRKYYAKRRDKNATAQEGS